MLEGVHVSLEEMLNTREYRAMLQNEMRLKYKGTILSFCLNIPGPVKTNPIIFTAFLSGKDVIYDVLENNNINIYDEMQINKPTGDELIMCVNCDANELKSLCCDIEENHPLGRIFDIDVIAADGKHLSRNGYRKCLICDNQAQICSSRQLHPIEDLQNKITDSIKIFAQKTYPGRINL